MQVELAELPGGRKTLVGLHETVSPVEGVTDSVKLTLPEKPARLVRLMLNDALEPDGKPNVDGLAENV